MMNDIPNTYSLDENNPLKQEEKTKQNTHNTHPLFVNAPVAQLVMDSTQSGSVMHYCRVCGMPFTPLSTHKYTAQSFRCSACNNASTKVLFHQMVQSCVMM